MGTGRIGLAVAAALAALCALPVAADEPGAPDAFAQQLLEVHNAERHRLGIGPLRWSEKLAADAAQWSIALARRGVMEHASHEVRRGEGENLSIGAAGYFAPRDLAGAFVDERQYFRPGKFPDNSTTGQWSDVGHYTQLIWAGTEEVGCAMTRGSEFDFLVCRYWPSGNWVGVSVP